MLSRRSRSANAESHDTRVQDTHDTPISQNTHPVPNPITWPNNPLHRSILLIGAVSCQQ